MEDGNESLMDEEVLQNSNLLTIAPFGMDLDVHSNRSSIIASVSHDISNWPTLKFNYLII